MGRQVLYDIVAREGLKLGVDILANAVKITLGPKGRNVIIDIPGRDPVITKDGVTVARNVYVDDPIQNIGAQMVKQVAQKTAEVAGDGTTTATVLAQAILTAGIKNVTAGANPMDLKKGIDKAVECVVASLKKQSQTVGDDNKKILQVATISANGDEAIGKLISDAVLKVGKDGVITIEESKTSETTVKIVDGLQIDRGYLSHFFVTNPAKMEAQLANPYILLVDKNINNMKDLLPILEKIVKTGRSLLIVCDALEGEAFTTLIINKNRHNLSLAAVKSPGFGDNSKILMEDLAVAVGGTVISEIAGYNIQTISLEHLGQADKITVDKDSTTFLSGKSNPERLANRIAEIKGLIEIADSDHEAYKLKERLAKLSGGVAVLYIGATTEIEMMEKKDRVEDALYATRAAVDEGIVAGGGVAYIRAIADLETLSGINPDENTGIDIIKKSIEEPLRQICANAGVEGSVILNQVITKKGDYGYNARTGVFEHMIKAGVIDPTKVTRIALENAASIASMLLTTECILTETAEETNINSQRR